MQLRTPLWLVLACLTNACLASTDPDESVEAPPGHEQDLDGQPSGVRGPDGVAADIEPSLALALASCPALTATNAQHVTAGRARLETRWIFIFTVRRYIAIGSNEDLGSGANTSTTLYEVSPGVFSKSSDRCSTPGDAGTAEDGGNDAGASTDAGIADAGSSAADAGPRPLNFPAPRQACPTLSEGTVTVLGRQVRLWMGSDGASKLGPALIYWHGTGSSPSEALTGLGSAVINEIKSAGGIVIAMNAYDGGSSGGSTTGNAVWYTGDFDVTDEVLACAVQTGVGIDTARIHTLGFSAGGLQASYMLKARSNYLASVTSYSGGAAFPVSMRDPNNKLPVIFFHGGSGDSFILNFQSASISMANDLKSAGHFVIMCDHGGGHWIPSAGGATSWQFFKDHRYGQTPEPYRDGLPASFPSYCRIF
jgi:predicted esterase